MGRESKTGGQGCCCFKVSWLESKKNLQIRRDQLPAATLPRQNPAHIPGPAPSTSDLASLWRTPFHFVKLWTAWSKGKHAGIKWWFLKMGGFQDRSKISRVQSKAMALGVPYFRKPPNHTKDSCLVCKPLDLRFCLEDVRAHASARLQQANKKNR